MRADRTWESGSRAGRLSSAYQRRRARQLPRARVRSQQCSGNVRLTIHAFEVADRYRNPVYVLADGALGQMMEPVEVPEKVQCQPEKRGRSGGRCHAQKPHHLHFPGT